MGGCVRARVCVCVSVYVYLYVYLWMCASVCGCCWRTNMDSNCEKRIFFFHLCFHQKHALDCGWFTVPTPLKTRFVTIWTPGQTVFIKQTKQDNNPGCTVWIWTSLKCSYRLHTMDFIERDRRITPKATNIFSRPRREVFSSHQTSGDVCRNNSLLFASRHHLRTARDSSFSVFLF